MEMGENLCDALAVAVGIGEQWEDKCDGVDSDRAHTGWSTCEGGLW